MLRAASHAFLAGVLRLKGVQADSWREQDAKRVYAEKVSMGSNQL
jgi:hypothetical protein